MTYQSATLLQKEQLTTSIFRFVFQSSSLSDALPGQHVLFYIGSKWVPYSIAEHIDKDTFCVYIKLLDDGVASQILRSLPPGANLHIRISSDIVHEFLDAPAVCIGLGTGVVPVYSVIEHTLKGRSSVPIHFLYSAQTDDDLVYVEKLMHLAEACECLNLEIAYDHSKIVKGTRERVGELAKKYQSRIFAVGARRDIAKNITETLVESGVERKKIYIF